MTPTPLLETIQFPEDIRALPTSRLPELADEVRAFTIESVAKTGGHLGASLGVVELTIALHAVFNTPEDRLIWDVGHQSYPHKILTGRRNQMDTLRQRHGLSGFTKRDESPYDAFGAGHSSTSISAALGMAVAARQMANDRKVIAVIGDGAMTAGLAFEAMNNAGLQDADLIVILNDNEMSISPNVGAISAYLSRILSSRPYTRFRDGTERVLERIAQPLKTAAKRAEEHMKGMIIPGTLFEELGFNYFGPINGHDFGQLLPTLQNIRRLSGPVLLHVVTQKGKGFTPAESNPCTYHGVPPFDAKTGDIPKAVNPTALSYTQIFSSTLMDLAEKNPKIVAITASMSEGTGLHPFQKRFPDRFYDVGIAEQHAVTFAAGLACEGLIPVVAIYSTFLQRAYDQIIHDVALQKLPVVFAVDRAGLVGADGPTHAGVFDLAFLNAVPELTLMAPSDGEMLRHMLATAVTLGKPVALRYPRGKAPDAFTNRTCGEFPTPPTIKVGRGSVVRSGGKEVALIAVGAMVQPALKAAELLERAPQSISVSVYDICFVKPLDRALILEAASRHDWLVTLEEGTLSGGFGASVLTLLSQESETPHPGSRRPAKRPNCRIWGLPDQFIPHGDQTALRAEWRLDAESIAARIQKMVPTQEGDTT